MKKIVVKIVKFHLQMNKFKIINKLIKNKINFNIFNLIKNLFLELLMYVRINVKLIYC